MSDGWLPLAVDSGLKGEGGCSECLGYTSLCLLDAWEGQPVVMYRGRSGQFHRHLVAVGQQVYIGVGGKDVR